MAGKVINVDLGTSEEHRRDIQYNACQTPYICSGHPGVLSLNLNFFHLQFKIRMEIEDKYVAREGVPRDSLRVLECNER